MSIVLNGDIPNTLGATALVTNAYLYTGDERYKRWVLEYVDVWLDRMRRNGGIMPDNVGPTGQIGEQRGGQWWGGLYGWYHFGGFNVMFSLADRRCRVRALAQRRLRLPGAAALAA